MARGRLISKCLGSSRRYHELLRAGGKLGEFCQVLFPLIVANTDDFGRMAADAFTVKNVVLPSSRRPESDFDRALDALHTVGLIVRYEVNGSIYLQVNQFDEHQPNLTKRTRSRFPEFQGNSGISEKVPLNLTESNLKESNVREENPEPALRAVDGFDAFWAAYPKKKAKDDARKAWQKRRPDAALLRVILDALQQQRQSPDWQKENGRYVPFPATWLNRGQWTDAADEPISTGLSDTARYNLAASEEAERLILDNETRRTGTHGHRRQQ
jgi:hypothetical protein